MKIWLSFDFVFDISLYSERGQDFLELVFEVWSDFSGLISFILNDQKLLFCEKNIWVNLVDGCDTAWTWL